MNISVINGYDLKLSRSAELEAQVLAFKKKGGKVKEMICAYKPKEASKPKVEDGKPKGGTKKSTKKDVKNKGKETDAAVRLHAQKAILKEYRSWAKRRYWMDISDKCNGEVKSGQLVMVFCGKSSIANPKQWDLVVKAIATLRKENESKKG